MLIAGVCPACKKRLQAKHEIILTKGYSEEPICIKKEELSRVYFNENGEREGLEVDETTDCKIEKYCHEFGESRESALERIEYIIQHFGDFGGGSSVDVRKVEDMFKRGLRIVSCARESQTQMAMLLYFKLALQWFGELGGIDNDTDLARKLGVTKANSNKYKNLFRDVVAEGLKVLPTVRGERNDAARKTFTAKRFEQEKQKQINHESKK